MYFKEKKQNNESKGRTRQVNLQVDSSEHNKIVDAAQQSSAGHTAKDNGIL